MLMKVGGSGLGFCDGLTTRGVEIGDTQEQVGCRCPPGAPQPRWIIRLQGKCTFGHQFKS